MTTQRNDGLVGHVLDDRYEVVKKLARGGMATVYVANDLRLSRTVALKVMNEGLGDSEDFVERFDTEARAAAHLSHPNVVSVFDQGVDNDRPYIVMEYVKGFTLRHLITREAPMDPRRVIELMEPVASALAAAHAAGLIHRDIKPENVLISDRGQVKVADFGLARAVTAQTNAATSGLVIGTVSYIAPELVTKGRADARSDVYSLGIVLYEMLTGRKPHQGDTPIQVAYSHVHNQINPPSMEVSAAWRDGHGSIPPYVDALVTTAANRDRENRPADAGVLLEHLRAAKAALARGVIEDPDLTARMRHTEPEPVSSATAVVPTLPAPRIGVERRFTPVTPVSPSFDVSADGAPFYSNGPLPYSPRSPHTRALPMLDPTAPPPGPGGSTRAARQGPRPRWGRILMVLLSVVALVGIGWGGWYILEGRWTTAPVVAAMSQTDAQATAQASGIGVVFEQEYSEDVPIGQVIRTDPAGGERVLRDGVMTAWVSRGPERHAVPNLVGKPMSQVEALLRDSTLVVGTVREDFSDKVAQGNVVSQGTKSGTQVKRGTKVDLVVSKGPAPVTVVSFVGRPLADLQGWAKSNAITLNTTEQFSDTVPRGTVISQQPNTGQATRASTMTVVVSKGTQNVAVPGGLRGLNVQDATDRLKAVGLNPQVKQVVNGGLGLVLNVSPGEGTVVPQGTTVVIEVV